MSQIFTENSWLFIISIGLVGLAIGSFLNVVVYRLPLMLETEWRQQCNELLEITPTEETTEKKFNLSYPASTCPKCGHKIRFWENIPVLSYLFLRGKCSNCGIKISLQYPLVEAVTATLSVIIAVHFGVSVQTLFALGFTWALVALTLIDAQKQLLPDNITLPLLWAGIIANMSGLFVDLESSVVGAIAGYLVLWSIYHLFRLLTGKEGMGYGDFKLLAALGAWMGWKMLPLIIVLSSFVGAAIGIAMIIFVRHDKNIPIPFGPYLAIAGWLAFIWGDSINKAWLGSF
ncbi:MAG: A24 family peptidase [Gammaproteobacteria bacterium]|nr:A24 family peptidase [Gammaproteobacteria bacterium]